MNGHEQKKVQEKNNKLTHKTTQTHAAITEK